MRDDLSRDPMFGINALLSQTLQDQGASDVRIVQSVDHATVSFRMSRPALIGPSVLAVHDALDARGVRVLQTTSGPSHEPTSILFARSADGTVLTPIADDVHDAILDDWFVCSNDRISVVVGKVSQDAKKRFPDGNVIHTSPIRNGETLEEGRIVRTINTAYLLRAPKDPSEIDENAFINAAIRGLVPVGVRSRADACDA